MSNFLPRHENVRFVFTQDLNDNRWAAIYKYILLRIMNATTASELIRNVPNSEGELHDFGEIFGNAAAIAELGVAITNFYKYSQLIQFNNSYRTKFINKYTSGIDVTDKDAYNFFYNINPIAQTVSFKEVEFRTRLTNAINVLNASTTILDPFKANFINVLRAFLTYITPAHGGNSPYGTDFRALGTTLNAQAAADTFYNTHVINRMPVFSGLKPNTYFNNKLRDMAKVPEYVAETEDEEDIFVGLNIEPNKWYRKQINGNYEYFIINQDPLGRDISEKRTVYVPEDNTCGGLNLDRTNCNNLLHILTTTDDVYIKTHLKTLLEDNAFWQDIKHSIETSELHPHLVIEILKRFGFKKRVGEPKICSVTHWLEKVVGKRFMDAASVADKEAFVNRVKNNEKLNKFLNYLVYYINCNPGLLDYNYTVTNDAYQEMINSGNDIPQWCKDLNIDPQRRYRNFSDDKSLENLVRTAGLNYGRNNYANIRTMRDNIIRYFTQILPQYNQAMYGGGLGIQIPLANIYDNMDNENCYKFYSDMFKRLIAQAERRNMKITNKDHNYINVQLKNLKIYQEKLRQILTKFAKILIENTNRNDRTEIIDINDYVTKLDARLDKTLSQQEKIRNSMYKILNSSAFAKELKKLSSKQNYEDIDAAFY